MTKLEDYSRNELKEIVKTKGGTDYHNLSKPELIKLINSLDNQNQEIVEEVVQKVAKEAKIKKKLSFKAQQWETYLKRVKLTPEEYLRNFPEHHEKKFIEELLTK